MRGVVGDIVVQQEAVDAVVELVVEVEGDEAGALALRESIEFVAQDGRAGLEAQYLTRVMFGNLRPSTPLRSPETDGSWLHGRAESDRFKGLIIKNLFVLR